MCQRLLSKTTAFIGTRVHYFSHNVYVQYAYVTPEGNVQSHLVVPLPTRRIAGTDYRRRTGLIFHRLTITDVRIFDGRPHEIASMSAKDEVAAIVSSIFRYRPVTSAFRHQQPVSQSKELTAKPLAELS